MKPSRVGSHPIALSLKEGFLELAAGVGGGLEASSFAKIRGYWLF